jgi:hypothetical protein
MFERKSYSSDIVTFCCILCKRATLGRAALELWAPHQLNCFKNRALVSYIGESQSQISFNTFIFFWVATFFSGSHAFFLGHNIFFWVTTFFLGHNIFFWVTTFFSGSQHFFLGHIIFSGSQHFFLGHNIFFWVTTKWIKIMNGDDGLRWCRQPVWPDEFLKNKSSKM